MSDKSSNKQQHSVSEQRETGLSVDKTPGGTVATTSSKTDISAFLKAAKATDPSGAGRIVFALDATMSRQPTWDRACEQQAAMFDAVDKLGGLSVQLVYFRGMGECRASKWVVNAAALRDLMTGISCRGGRTQIRKVLKNSLKEHGIKRVSALVYIGDAMEEDADELCHLAGEMGLKGLKLFMFQEGGDPTARAVFAEMARLSGGAHVMLGPDSGKILAELLGAVAVYARGGRKALEGTSSRGSRMLIEHLKPEAGR